MIELTYFENSTQVFQVTQFRPGQSWRIVHGGELLGSIVKIDGIWVANRNSVLVEGLVESIGKFIDLQHFNKLPEELETHWPMFIRQVIIQGDDQYLIVCLPDIDFNHFEKLFKTYISTLIKDRWEILFKVYDAEMSADFQVLVKQGQLVQ
ncbi:MAG: hypothetical protein WKF66_15695 [Pedobacter sp.]